MISSSPEKAIKNIFERAASSLSDSRDQLDKTRRLLKKAIHRLLVSTNRSNDQVNAILDDIKTSSDNNINLDELNSQLDKLFVLINNSDYLKQTANEKAFHSVLKDSIGDINCSESCITLINNFSESKLSDNELSLEILKLLNDATV